jgi:hypothetical protein
MGRELGLGFLSLGFYGSGDTEQDFQQVKESVKMGATS